MTTITESTFEDDVPLQKLVSGKFTGRYWGHMSNL